MTLMKNTFMALGLSALALTTMQTTADAGSRLRCSGPYQVISGHGKIFTPYCEDSYLAQVARSYGMRVSNRAVRQNPNTKQEACRIAGHDPRVSNICDGHSGFRFHR